MPKDMKTLLAVLLALTLVPAVADAAPRLTLAQAKSETRRQMWIEASTWDYQGYVSASIVRCARQSATRISCGFEVYERLASGGPPDPRICGYVAHVRLPKHSRRPVSTVERVGCERRF